MSDDYDLWLFDSRGGHVDEHRDIDPAELERITHPMKHTRQNIDPVNSQAGYVLTPSGDPKAAVPKPGVKQPEDPFDELGLVDFEVMVEAVGGRFHRSGELHRRRLTRLGYMTDSFVRPLTDKGHRALEYFRSGAGGPTRRPEPVPMKDRPAMYSSRGDAREFYNQVRGQSRIDEVLHNAPRQVPVGRETSPIKCEFCKERLAIGHLHEPGPGRLWCGYCLVPPTPPKSEWHRGMEDAARIAVRRAVDPTRERREDDARSDAFRLGVETAASQIAARIREYAKHTPVPPEDLRTKKMVAFAEACQEYFTDQKQWNRCKGTESEDSAHGMMVDAGRKAWRAYYALLDAR